LYDDRRLSKISDEKYYALLLKHIDRLGIDSNKYPNILSLRRALETSRGINYSKVAKELESFVFILKKTLPYKDYFALAKTTGNFTDIDETFGELMHAAVKCGVDLSADFPCLNGYFGYMELTRKINPIELVNEEKKLKDEINLSFSGTKIQREIIFMVSFGRYLKDFLNNAISSSDYEYYKENIAEYKKLWVKHADNKVLSLLDGYLAQADKFYETNLARNVHFAENIFAEAKAEKIENPMQYIGDIAGIINNIGAVKRVDIVIAGGFHMDAILDALKDNNVSYAAIMPNVTGGTQESEKTYYRAVREQSEISFQTLANLAASLSFVDQVKLWMSVDPDAAKRIYGDKIQIFDDSFSIPASGIELPLKNGRFVPSEIESFSDRENLETLARLIEMAKLVESNENGDIYEAVADIVRENLPQDGKFAAALDSSLLDKINYEKLESVLADEKKLEALLTRAQISARSKNKYEEFIKLIGQFCRDAIEKGRKINFPGFALTGGRGGNNTISEDANIITNFDIERQIRRLELNLLNIGIENIPVFAIRTIAQYRYKTDASNPYGIRPDTDILHMIGVNPRKFVLGEIDNDIKAIYPDKKAEEIFLIMLRNTFQNLMFGYETRYEDETVELKDTPVFIVFNEDNYRTNVTDEMSYDIKISLADVDGIINDTKPELLKRWYSRAPGKADNGEMFSVMLSVEELRMLLAGAARFIQTDLKAKYPDLPSDKTTHYSKIVRMRYINVYLYKKFLEKLSEAAQNNIETSSFARLTITWLGKILDKLHLSKTKRDKIAAVIETPFILLSSFVPGFADIFLKMHEGESQTRETGLKIITTFVNIAWRATYHSFPVFNFCLKVINVIKTNYVLHRDWNLSNPEARLNIAASGGTVFYNKYLFLEQLNDVKSRDNILFKRIVDLMGVVIYKYGSHIEEGAKPDEKKYSDILNKADLFLANASDELIYGLQTTDEYRIAVLELKTMLVQSTNNTQTQADIEKIVAALKNAVKNDEDISICFVCSANINRSPAAHVLFRQFLRNRDKKNITVYSAGIAIGAFKGKKLISALRQALTGQVDGDILDSFSTDDIKDILKQNPDFIITASQEHRRYLSRYFPELKDKMILFGELAPSIFRGIMPNPQASDISYRDFIELINGVFESVFTDAQSEDEDRHKVISFEDEKKKRSQETGARSSDFTAAILPENERLVEDMFAAGEKPLKIARRVAQTEFLKSLNPF
ncbi:MAG: hypothetical protein LBO62_06585, partial [Endomicrobium sp.]|nr:hypothetical protein [Endomicrobium sp.]